jgi:hypothetical protein
VNPNPSPLLVAWAGPLVGAVLPLMSWLVVGALRLRVAYLFRFFAGFCLIANGAYIGAGAIVPVGDAADLLRLRSTEWTLALFGLLAIPVGLALWNRQKDYFGLGSQPRTVNRADTIGCALLLAAIVAAEVLI